MTRVMNKRELVEKLAAAGATAEEIADYLGMKLDAVQRRFGKTISKMRAKFKIALRKRQFELATGKKADVRMLQWLGRCYLNQNGAEIQDAVVNEPVKTYVGIDVEAV